MCRFDGIGACGALTCKPLDKELLKDLLRCAVCELDLAAEYFEEQGDLYVAENKRSISDKINKFLRENP